MSFTVPNVIRLSGNFEQFKDVADVGTIKPGHLVEKTATGVKLHAKANGHAERAFADIDADQGYTTGMTGTTKDTAYTTGTSVKYVVASPGAVVLARLATGQSVSKGAKLVSDGAGGLQAETHADSGAEPTDIVAFAMETVNNSGGTVPWIPVRVK